jgi:glycosyltransferase involved in cell wall biosynthesis
LEKLCKNCNITVEYLGPQLHSKIPKLLAEAQALILPSFWEGLPTVILEAMAAKVPVITTPVGDIPYLIQHGKNGLLFNHNLNSLDRIISYIFEEPEKLIALSKNAFKFVDKNYNTVTVHKKLFNVYENLLNGDFKYYS